MWPRCVCGQKSRIGLSKDNISTLNKGCCSWVVSQELICTAAPSKIDDCTSLGYAEEALHLVCTPTQRERYIYRSAMKPRLQMSRVHTCLCQCWIRMGCNGRSLRLSLTARHFAFLFYHFTRDPAISFALKVIIQEICLRDLHLCAWTFIDVFKAL